jgi:hypothetical protein
VLKHLITLTDFAARVPFSLEDIAAASGNLAVVAKDAKQLNDILEITGNVAGATGLDFQTTASQIQRAFSRWYSKCCRSLEKKVLEICLVFQQVLKYQ